MLFANILDAEVVHDKDELDGTPCVAPKPWGGGRFVVATGVQPFAKEVVRELAGLRQSVGAADHLEKDPPLVHKWGVGAKVVLVPEFLGDVGVFDLNIFFSFHLGGLKIEISGIKARKLGALP